jgi:hypothetical protein
MGVNPDTLKMRPGYQPAPTRGPMMASDTADYSRPNSAPAPATMPPVRTLPKPAPEGCTYATASPAQADETIPMPRPRPTGAGFPADRGMPTTRGWSPQAAALAEALSGRMDYGMMRRNRPRVHSRRTYQKLVSHMIPRQATQVVKLEERQGRQISIVASA